jgi:ApaG protein
MSSGTGMKRFIRESNIIDPQLASKVTNISGRRLHVLNWNYVETAIESERRSLRQGPCQRLVPAELFAMMGCMYRAVTRQIEVTVEPNFMPERSSAENSRYFWSYTIVITNSGEETVQLQTRHWIITDASGKRQEVRGEGVVGEQPVLAPGERFEYTSGVPLSTASGFMTGRYQMVSESGEKFEIDVPTFSLDSPEAKRVLN